MRSTSSIVLGIRSKSGIVRNNCWIGSISSLRGGIWMLDAASALGHAKLPEDPAWNITGINVDPGQIEAARAGSAHPHVHFIVMDATKLQFQDAEFDIVASSMVTHHVPGWESSFSEMIRVLRPGGYLIYSDFMFPSWLAAVGRRLIPFVGIPWRKQVESLASKAGLTKVHEARAALRFDFIWLRN